MKKKIQTNWIIITGAPCSGKTKVIEKLSYLNYKTFPEVSRLIIDEKISRGYSIAEIISDRKKFETSIWDMKNILETQSHTQSTIIFDRSLIDSFAFWQNIESIDFNFNDFPLYYRYKKVFFLDPLPFVKDSARIHTEKESEELEKSILFFYNKLEYNPIKIPLMPIDDRCNLILKKIKDE